MDEDEVSCSQKACFYIDQTPVNSSHYIFDGTYKNAGDKQKFQKNPKFKYFNTLLKMKNNYLSQKKDLYQHIFNPQESKTEVSVSHASNDFYIRSPDFQNNRFHVEKLNNHAFKIYKNRSRSLAGTSNIVGLTSPEDINFKFNFKGNQKGREKPEILQVMKEYRQQNARKTQGNIHEQNSRKTQGNFREAVTQQSRKKSQKNYSNMTFISQKNFDFESNKQQSRVKTSCRPRKY